MFTVFTTPIEKTGIYPAVVVMAARENHVRNQLALMHSSRRCGVYLFYSVSDSSSLWRPTQRGLS